MNHITEPSCYFVYLSPGNHLYGQYQSHDDAAKIVKQLNAKDSIHRAFVSYVWIRKDENQYLQG